MTSVIKRLAPGFALLVVASGILLATDQQRRSGTGPRVYRVALLQHGSTAVLDDTAAGVVDDLAARGMREGQNLLLERFNPQGDFGTSGTMAQTIVNGPYDLVITLSTPSLQSVAGANKRRHMPHVFGLVVDQFAAGVGLDRAAPAKHPPYLVGERIHLPVDESFRLARQMFPDLKHVGVVWSPAELNSRVFTEEAREACRALDINLIEAATDNSAGVLEAIHSVIGRGAQAIWVGGDNNVMTALDSVIATARKAGIPVFSIQPGKPDRGTLLDAGLDFHECGKLTGLLAAARLEGKDPAAIPIRDVLDRVPRRLIVNRLALKGLKEPWKIPDEIRRQADIVVDENGMRKKGS